MKISTKGRYALRTMLDLSMQDRSRAKEGYPAEKSRQAGTGQQQKHHHEQRLIQDRAAQVHPFCRDQRILSGQPGNPCQNDRIKRRKMRDRPRQSVSADPHIAPAGEQASRPADIRGGIIRQPDPERRAV